jgi:hypothetical protein
MNQSRSIFFVSFFSFAVASMAGCMGSSEPEPTVNSTEEAIVDESGTLSIPVQNELQLERATNGEAFTIVPNAAFKEVAPGVFEGAAEEGASRILVGAEGHKWAIEQAEKDLTDLRARNVMGADEDSATLEAMKQLEAQIANLEKTMQNIAAPVGTPQAVSCNIGFYTGPSSSIAGFYGATGLAQVSCSGGCQTFTIQAQACTNLGCSPVYASSRSVCSTPWAYGVSRSGTYGASCSAAASVSPPGIMSSWNGFCG